MKELQAIFVAGWPLSGVVLVLWASFVSLVSIALSPARFKRVTVAAGITGIAAPIAIIAFRATHPVDLFLWMLSAGSFGAMSALGIAELLTNDGLANRGSRWFIAISSGGLAVLMIAVFL